METMEIVEIKCKNCEKRIYVQSEYVRMDMFCTLGCLQAFKNGAMT